MILSNVKIVEAIQQGLISISPSPRLEPGAPPFNTSSIDLTLADEILIPIEGANVTFALKEKFSTDFLERNWRAVKITDEQPTYHTHDTAPAPNQTWADVYSRTTPIAFPPDIHFEANFNHIVGSGYSAGYYGYLWSKVYAQDMFARFSRDGLLNPQTGALTERFLRMLGLRMRMYRLRILLGTRWIRIRFMRRLVSRLKRRHPGSGPFRLQTVGNRRTQIELLYAIACIERDRNVI